METGNAYSDVTVVVVTYGEYSGLLRTVSSVLEQTCPINRIILSDDGSGVPFPGEVLDLLKAASCPVVIRQGEENLGTTAHLNLLASMCASEYIKFLGVGDAFSDSEALGALADCIRLSGTVAATSQVIVADEELRCRYYTFPGGRGGQLCEKTGEELFRTLALGNIVSAVGAIFQRRFFEEMGGFDASYRLLEDWPAWLRLAREGHRVSFLDRVTCLYAIGGVSSKKGNAFYSPVLKADMIRCYEQEILPSVTQFVPEERRVIEYGYQLAQGKSNVFLWKTFGWLHGKHLMKRGIKWGLFKIKKAFRMPWSA